MKTKIDRNSTEGFRDLPNDSASADQRDFTFV